MIWSKFDPTHLPGQEPGKVPPTHSDLVMVLDCDCDQACDPPLVGRW